MAFSWRSEPTLMERLRTAQNHVANVNQDIVTFAGYCDSRDELERHVMFYETKAANWTPKRRTR